MTIYPVLGSIQGPDRAVAGGGLVARPGGAAMLS
jgi:hypothetical protein